DSCALMGCEAVALFADRAKSAFPGFELSPDDLEDLIALVTQLDGLPLALEIAAARAPMGIKLLRQRIHLLLKDANPAKRDQETLEKVIDWSFQLLREPERRLLQRLAVFTGGFFAPAAEAVCTFAAEKELPAVPIALDD